MRPDFQLVSLMKREFQHPHSSSPAARRMLKLQAHASACHFQTDFLFIGAQPQVHAFRRGTPTDVCPSLNPIGNALTDCDS